MQTAPLFYELTEDEIASVNGGISLNILKEINDAYVYAKEAWAEFERGFADGSR